MHRQIISLSLSLSLIFFLAVVSALPTTIHHHQKTRQSQEDGDIEENVPSHLRPGRSWDSQHGRREVSVSVSAVHQETISMDPASSSEMEMELELDPETEGEIFDLGSCPDARIVFTDSSNDGDASFFESRETAPTFTRVEAVDVDLIADFICHQLAVKCQASMVAVEACHAGAAAAKGKSGQDAADAFNAALLGF